MDGTRRRVVCPLHKGGDQKNETRVLSRVVYVTKSRPIRPRTESWATPQRQVRSN